ncbi:hypothetical protein [Aromatoleum evansii]|uniref:hypothetical protein n=1 Tax=Aromatoleum evansii TaxID=59406 RepID=UPI001B7CEF29|nr:hypothetical protein [Aromatoleum evansii]
MTSTARNEIERAIASDLTSRNGPLIGGANLWRLLGYASGEAFRQAAKRGCLPVPIIHIPHRRRRFALAIDIARWLGRLRETSCQSQEGGLAGRSCEAPRSDSAGTVGNHSAHDEDSN